jgi:hypothetical protein
LIEVRLPGAPLERRRVIVTDSAPYRFAVAIDPSDIDFMGHVNNASYLKWVQEAVISHWRGIAPAEEIARHLWVALKHEITYRKPAFVNDDVIATVILKKSLALVPFTRRSFGGAKTYWQKSVQVGAAWTQKRGVQRGLQQAWWSASSPSRPD